MRLFQHYILQEHEVIPVDLKTWAQWFESSANRHVAREQIGASNVSTVFIGLDHSFGDGPPLLFETMVFGGALDQEQKRCTTWEQAEEMHKAMCERIRNSLKGNSTCN